MKERLSLRIFLPLALLIFFSFTNKKRSAFLKQMKTYSAVEKGTTFINGEQKDFEAFYIAKTEVTNLDYQEFLNDLEKQGRTEDLELAQLQPEQWLIISENVQPFVEIYHQHPAYMSYPVLTIPHEGAKLYCNWLTEKYNTLHPSKNGKKIVFRLPSKTEWIAAARGRHQNAPYPWGGVALQNARGQWLANFRRVGEGNISYNMETKNYEIVKDTSVVNVENIKLPAPVESYCKNDYGLYHMSGNVAEMIQEKGIAMGGSWNSAGYNVRIESEMNYERPSPFVGFRPVAVEE